jgi:hypothetical protein
MPELLQADRPAGTDPRPLVSILVAAYNEGAILERNLGEIHAHMRGLEDRYRFELVVVDDGSTDRTAEIALDFAGRHANVRVLRHPRNYRLGQALRFGFGQCRGEYIVTLDVDLSYAPEHIGRLLERIAATKAKIVVASPYMRGGRTTRVPLLRKLLSRWGNRFLALTARGMSPSGDVSTLTGMTRAYDARFVRSLSLRSMGMEINTEVLYKAMILGARIEEIPGHLDWTAQRESHQVRRSGMRIRRGIVFSLLTGFIIRPVAFFIVPGILLHLVSWYVVAWVAIHVITHYREVAALGGGFDAIISESLARAFRQSPHAFVVGGVSLIVSMQLIGLGVLALQLQQYFDELFHLGTRVYSHSRELERIAAASRAEAEAAGGPERAKPG